MKRVKSHLNLQHVRLAHALGISTGTVNSSLFWWLNIKGHSMRVHPHLRLIRRELLRKLFSPHNREKLRTQPIIELFSPCEGWPISKCECACLLQYNPLFSKIVHTIGFFTNAQSWQYWHYCQLCNPIYLQFPSLFATYYVSKYEIRYQWM